MYFKLFLKCIASIRNGSILSFHDHKPNIFLELENYYSNYLRSCCQNINNFQTFKPLVFSVCQLFNHDKLKNAVKKL